jgi:hypothetical protein
MAMKKRKKSERGQAITLFALLVPITTLFAMGILEYMVTNSRVMETVAAADLAAHAGAQEIRVLPDGSIEATEEGRQVATAYFQAQRPEHSVFAGASCGQFDGRPGCRVQSQVQSMGYLLPQRWIGVNAIGYLAHGVTRGDQ